jgi:hypothetical protein
LSNRIKVLVNNGACSRASAFLTQDAAISPPLTGGAGGRVRPQVAPSPRSPPTRGGEGFRGQALRLRADLMDSFTSFAMTYFLLKRFNDAQQWPFTIVEGHEIQIVKIAVLTGSEAPYLQSAAATIFMCGNVF